MTSFVAEVLTSAGQLETKEATSKLKQLSDKIESLKLQVYDVTVNKYDKFPPKLLSTEQLVSDVQGIKAEMADVEDRIENQIKSQLNMSTGEFQLLTGKLENANSLLVVLEKLANLQDGLSSVECAVRRRHYSEAADAVHQVKAVLAEKVCGYEDEISILQAIQDEAHIQMEKLHKEMSDTWADIIQWTVPDPKAIKDSETVKCVLTINVKEEVTPGLLEKLVIGLKKMNSLNVEMKKFSKQLFSHMIQPIMNEVMLEVFVSESGSRKVLTVEVKKQADSDDEMVSPVPSTMFANLDKVLRFLNENLLHVVISVPGDSDKDQTLMTVLGRLIANETLDMAVKQCLIRAIPRSNKELEQFTDVLTLTGEVQKGLVKIGFIESDNTILLDYIQNVNTLFANKKCQEILEQAHKLMTVEVHNTVRVSHDKPLGELPSLGEEGSGGKKARKTELASESPLSANTFTLPTCLISSSIQMLMTLVYETLQEATRSSPQCAIQLFCGVRSVFEQFCSVFPTYHKQKLETLPQFSALHYNNCMYIAHHLMTLGHQFGRQLPQNINATFVDLVPKVRRLGTESFLQQLCKQKAQMLEYLEAANGFQNVSEKNIFLATEQAIKQVLYQLTHLKNVWQDVLPPSNYRKAMGGLLNSVIMHMTDCIIALEDISADDTKQLSLHLNTIADRAPELFEVPGDDANVTVEIQRNVAKWQRFRELDMILNASMIDISDRWAAGKGPLAVVFSANEVKQLIRALFQNTDRRAQMLAKIK